MKYNAHTNLDTKKLLFSTEDVSSAFHWCQKANLMMASESESNRGSPQDLLTGGITNHRYGGDSQQIKKKSFKSFEAKFLKFKIKRDGVLRLLQQIGKMKKTEVNSSIKAAVMRRLKKKRR
jgi:hypothetical protein